MAASKSIGSLYIDIEARTAQMETDLAKATTQLKDFQRSLNSGAQGSGDAGTTMTTAFTKGSIAAGLVSAALNAVSGEAKYVAENIQKIPGISGETIDSINRMNYAFSQSKNAIDQAIAKGEQWFSQFGQGIGYGLGALVYGVDNASEAYEKMGEEAKAFAEIPYDKQLAGIQEQINAINDQTAAESHLRDIRAQRVDYLKQESQLFQAIAAGEGKRLPDELLQAHPKVQQYIKQASLTGGETPDYLLGARNLGAEADLESAQGELKIYKDAVTQMQAYQTTLDKSTLSHKGLNAQLDYWKEKLAEGNDLLQQGAALVDQGDKGEGFLKEADAYKKMADAQSHLNELMKKMKEPTDMIRDTFVKDFGDMSNVLTSFITGGQSKFKDFLKTLSDDIINTFMKLAVINPMMNELFQGSGSYTSSPSLWSSFLGGGGAGAADSFSLASTDLDTFSLAGLASGGPINGPHWVGENGPEIFTPPSGGGTIIPNQQTGGQAAGATYNIDARGADEARIDKLERTLVALNGSVEHRAVSAIVSAQRRGGNLGRALGTTA